MWKDSRFDNSTISILIPLFQQLCYDYTRRYSMEEGEDKGIFTIFVMEKSILSTGI